MEIGESIIETGVDKLVKLVKERGRIALADSAKELGVSTTVIQEWVDFLEDEGIISVEYKLTKPYLVERKLTKKEVDVKSKEFEGKKEGFIRKAEVSLSFLQKQSEDLKKVKSEFDKLKGELGLQLDTVRSELEQLEKYQQLKQDMQKQIENQKSDAKIKIDDLIKQITAEQRRYQELVSEVNRERDDLTREKAEAKSIEESEKMLSRKLLELKSMISMIEKKVSDEDSSIKNSESHIERLNAMVEQIKKRVEEEKSTIDPLITKSQEQQKKVLELQDSIIKKIAQNKNNITHVKEITGKVNTFFQKKLAVVNLVDKVNKDRDDLEKSLIELIRKAKAFQLTAKSSDVGKDMEDLEKKFKEVDDKKSAFEGELKNLTSFFKG
ncbi:MAG TPA: hypothetical protein VJJ52_07185 [Candidatus Nanoarchaeia archaeon]|nr:hypothetical protein [Candidatus Nanoarchaeia archaeon]